MLANLIYVAALLAISPIVLYRMIRHGRYRRGLSEKLWGLSASGAGALTDNRPCVWIHAVSVGEVNLLPGIVNRLKPRLGETPIVISTSTDTGYDLAVKHFGAERVFFCPLDFSWAVRRTIRSLRPHQLVLAELELWPNLIRAAQANDCEVLVVNGRLSERSARRYARFGLLTRPTFERLHWVGCQDDACRDRFTACGTKPDRLQVTGSLKFDDAPISRDTADVHACAQWAGIDPWHRVWVVGSTQSGEEQMGLEVYKELSAQHPELRLIVVPRHKERFDEVAKLITSAGLKPHRRSSDRSLYDDVWQQDTVILVDTIGELRHWWGVGQIATVGGSFGDRGGQNMLEPAGYGCALSFGPNTRNFQWIADRLLAAGGAVQVDDRDQLMTFVQRCLEDIPAADALGRAARSVVLQHRGAAERTVDAIAGQRTQRQAA